MLICIFKIADNNQNKILACRTALQQKNTISTPTTAKKTSKTTIYLILQQFLKANRTEKILRECSTQYVRIIFKKM
jgi:hypothetical protein